MAHHLAPELIHQPRCLEHPNGAAGLRSMLLVVDDPDVESTAARYALILGTEPVTERPLRVLALPLGRVEIVAVSKFRALFPGEPVRALQYMAGGPVGP